MRLAGIEPVSSSLQMCLGWWNSTEQCRGLYCIVCFLHHVTAGTVMYEYGLRVGQELSNLKGLQQQAKCYLAMINALRLVDPKYAWIVKPIPSTLQVHLCVSAWANHRLLFVSTNNDVYVCHDKYDY